MKVHLEVLGNANEAKAAATKHGFKSTHVRTIETNPFLQSRGITKATVLSIDFEQPDVERLWAWYHATTEVIDRIEAGDENSGPSVGLAVEARFFTNDGGDAWAPCPECKRILTDAAPGVPKAPGAMHGNGHVPSCRFASSADRMSAIPAAL